MQSNNGSVAWAMAAVVVIALVGFMLYQYQQQQLAAQRARDPASNIIGGIAQLAGGIVSAATS